MADISRLSRRAAASWLTPVMLVRTVIVLMTLLLWQLAALSGWLYADVVPPLPKIGAALTKLLSTGEVFPAKIRDQEKPGLE